MLKRTFCSVNIISLKKLHNKKYFFEYTCAIRRALSQQIFHVITKMEFC